jgi:hypothetical protein
VALWPELPVQRRTVHKHRSLFAHAPKKLHEYRRFLRDLSLNYGHQAMTSSAPIMPT